MKAKPRQDRGADPLKDATLVALKSIIDPLIGLMLDVGITAPEFSKLVRERSVRIAAGRLQSQTGRTSHSRVSIATGLPRSEVAKILKPAVAKGQPKRTPHAARRILDAWYQSPAFLLASGEPAPIPIFGPRCSLEYLVAKHGAGIPVRAMLDELIQIDAIEQLADQRVRAKSRIPIMRGPSPGAITAMGERASELLVTLTHNLRQTIHPFFEATAVASDVNAELVALIRRDISDQGTKFVDGINELLSRSRAPNATRRKSTIGEQTTCRIGVTVYYFQDQFSSIGDCLSLSSARRRKNLLRSR